MSNTKDFDKTLYSFVHCLADDMQNYKLDEKDNVNGTKLMMNILMSSLTSQLAISGEINFRYTGLEFQKKCLICNQNFKKDQICRTPTCEHLFHAKCICGLIKETKKRGMSFV